MTSPGTLSIKQPPAAERVYAHVKQGVLERRYEGGTLLTEGELAEAVGVSRTPVREALLRLEVEGLIKLYPKKGALVLPVSAQEIADVVETRLLVEEHAARKAVPAPAGLVERLEELLTKQKAQAAAGDLAGAAVTDRCFHAEIVRSGGTRSSPASTTSCATVNCGWASPSCTPTPTGSPRPSPSTRRSSRRCAAGTRTRRSGSSTGTSAGSRTSRGVRCDELRLLVLLGRPAR